MDATLRVMGYATVAVAEERDVFRPGLGSDILDLPVGHRGEPGEHVAQVGVGIDAAAAATLDNGVKNGCVDRHGHRPGTANSFSRHICVRIIHQLSLPALCAAVGGMDHALAVLIRNRLAVRNRIVIRHQHVSQIADHENNWDLGRSGAAMSLPL